MSEKRQIKLEMQVNNEECDVVTHVTSTGVTDALGYTPMNSTARGATNGVASLSSGKVPASELPSYVDDVVEGYYYNGAFYEEAAHTTLITGETGKIYVDLSSNGSYRWSGTAYIEISQSITVDSELSNSSTNPVQNKVITQRLEDITKMLFPKLTINSIANATYTAVCGTRELTGTIRGTGSAEIYLPVLGTWTVTITTANGTKSATVSASESGASYSTTITFATLAVTSDTGNTVTATNGAYTVTGTATNGSCSLTLGVGTWSLSASDGTLTVTDSVSIASGTTTTSKTLSLPTITVTTDANASVSATDGTRTVTGTASSGGSCVLKVVPGTWTVTTTNGTVSATSGSVNVATHSNNYAVSISLPYITLTGDVGNTVTATKDTTVVSGTVGSDGTCVLKVAVGTWTVKSTSPLNSNIYVTDTVSVSTNGINYPLTMTLPTITVTTAAGASVSATKNGVTVSGTASSTGSCVLKVTTGTWSVSATSDGETKSGSVTLSAHSTNKNISLTFVQIYGAQWDGSSSTAWTRTDAAAAFADPVPYKSGMTASQCSSPFDNLMPWSGMTKSTRTGGVMVAIPKFWYKITQSGAGMKVQIADAATTGFSPSPAHMNRGDGAGERDVVYIGRYHCSTSDWKSTSGVKPKASITRSTARSSIHNLGAKIWQSDFAMRFTLWLLYIVEFADWNSQAKIGYGCGNNSSTENMGYTDSMPYHTGTTQSSRTTYGLGTQYRNIEGLWDNVYDWCDGCYNNSNGLNLILNPANFSDSSGGTSVGTPSNGYPSVFSVKDVSGTYQMFIPTAASGSESTYSCDGWSFVSSGPCVYVGGNYSQGGNLGLFCVGRCGTSDSDDYVGSRLQELP